MKNILNTYIALLLFTLFVNSSFSQVPTYTLTAKNFNRSAPDSLTFEVYLFHTNPGTAEFKYPAGQYFFKFNPLIANGGTLKYRTIGTGLPPAAVPQNASISGNELRLASNLPVNQNDAPLISSTGNGTLVVKMSLRTTASSFDLSQPLNLTWKGSADGGFYTKISAYVGIFIQDISTYATHSIDTNTVSISQFNSAVPSEYKIFQNYPNPFNPSTKIRFDVPENSKIKLSVFDVAGKELDVLLNDKLTPGSYEFKWDATGYSSGVYFYRIESNDFIETKRMLLIK